ncbi:MAG: hypothetical protein MRJ93_03045 [Nitrososphaeraceae archaeon]|nr:hypothetical protein [Nitrososphaeraceae archaeon]
MNTKTKMGFMLLLTTVILVTGIISTTIPKSLAEPGANIQEIKCVNFNLNINGIDVKKIPRGVTEDSAAQQLNGNNVPNGGRNGLFDEINVDKNLVNICLNFDFNHQKKFDPVNSDFTTPTPNPMSDNT